jgi:hypothetical protein
MKAMVENGKIYNFVPDNYIAGNKEIDDGTHESIKILPIKGFADGIDMEAIAKNETRVKGTFLYYLDNGIVKKRTDDEIKAMPEFVEYIRSQRQKRYEKEVDPLTLEAIRVGVSTSAGIELKKQANKKVAQIKLELPKE